MPRRLEDRNVRSHHCFSRLSPAAVSASAFTASGYRRDLSGSGGSAGKQLPQKLARVALLDLGDLLRRAGDDDFAAGLSALEAEVDEPVSLLDHVEVVLDHGHRVAGVREALEHLEGFSMSAKCRPVVGSSRV